MLAKVSRAVCRAVGLALSLTESVETPAIRLWIESTSMTELAFAVEMTSLVGLMSVVESISMANGEGA